MQGCLGELKLLPRIWTYHDGGMIGVQFRQILLVLLAPKVLHVQVQVCSNSMYLTLIVLVHEPLSLKLLPRSGFRQIPLTH